MKIYILTINDHQNFGNRLQNYALVRLLNNCSEEVVGTAYLFQSSKLKMGVSIAKIRRAVAPFKRALKAAGVGGFSGIRRTVSFERFTREFCPEIKNLYAGLTVAGDREIYVLGSDQVWNYTFQLSEADLEARLGMFASGNRVFSYAASLGLDCIDERWTTIFNRGWSRLSNISVREERAAELVREISGREATVVLDPTLMLTRNDWEELFTGFVSSDDKYVLTYFLGPIKNDKRKKIEDFAREHGLRVRMLNCVEDSETFAAGPAEFVELFANAKYVFTDSYHACCFSLLFHIPFKVFHRSGFSGERSMNSRMQTLFALLELGDIMHDNSNLVQFDWEKIDTLLNRHRRRSQTWLNEAIIRASSDVAE